MISNAELKEFVRSRSWYQTINFEEDIVSKGCEWCGDPAWGNISKFLPESLKGKTVVDLGCNAGLFCVKSALLGAEKVIGVDFPGWRPKWDFREQQTFVKAYFEQKHNTSLPITYIADRMENFLRDYTEPIDYIYAIASIYYTQTPNQVVKDIARLTNNVILRLRDENRVDQFTKLFENTGFKVKQVLQEKWWEKLNRNTDDFYLYHYAK